MIFFASKMKMLIIFALRFFPAGFSTGKKKYRMGLQDINNCFYICSRFLTMFFKCIWEMNLRGLKSFVKFAVPNTLKSSLKILKRIVRFLKGTRAS